MFIKLPYISKPNKKNATKKLHAPHMKSKMRRYGNRYCLNGEEFLSRGRVREEFDKYQAKQLVKYKYKKAIPI